MATLSSDPHHENARTPTTLWVSALVDKNAGPWSPSVAVRYEAIGKWACGLWSLLSETPPFIRGLLGPPKHKFSPAQSAQHRGSPPPPPSGSPVSTGNTQVPLHYVSPKWGMGYCCGWSGGDLPLLARGFWTTQSVTRSPKTQGRRGDWGGGTGPGPMENALRGRPVPSAPSAVS